MREIDADVLLFQETRKEIGNTTKYSFINKVREQS